MISDQIVVIRGTVSVVFEWDVKLYPPIDYEEQQPPDGRTYRRLNYVINIVQGPALIQR